MRKIQSVEEFLSLDSSGLANTTFDCPYCGQTHTVPIKTIHVGQNLMPQIRDMLEKALGHNAHKPTLIYDKAIESFIFQNVLEPLRQSGVDPVLLPLEGKAGHLLEASDVVGDAAAELLQDDTDILIGSGSGVISDLTKWMATSTKKPFIIIGTAVSMNGHSSITSAMTFNGIKETAYDLIPASAVVYDIDILAKAPMEMNLSGMADMTARTTCNADWKLSNLLRGTDFCPLPYQMMIKPQERFLSMAAGIAARQPEAVHALADANLISGLTMTVLNGGTSPSSGAEHVLSHFWDLMNDLQGKQHSFHGTQVGIGVVIALSLYERVRSLDPAAIDPQALLDNRRSLAQIEAAHRALYKPDLAEHFINVARQKRIPDDQYLAYVDNIRQNWAEIWQAVEPFTTSVESVRDPLATAGAPLKLAQVGRTRAEGLESLLNGNHYRPRYTILDLAWELGVFPGAAEEILERADVI